MSFWVRLLTLFNTQMEIPPAWGRFHLISWGIAISAAVILCLIYQYKPFSVRAIILITSIAVIIAEIYKQINLSFTYSDGIQFHYLWRYFPWQFCSTPMFVGLLAGMIPKGRLHRMLCAYLATYAFFAGLCVMIYPGDVFTETVGINIQTMLCHGSMLTIGILLFRTGHVEASPKAVLRAFPVFISALLIAVLLNEHAYRVGLLAEHDFNMFYVSPYCESHLSIFAWVQERVPFPGNLLVYIAVFSLGATLITLSAMCLSKCRKRQRFSIFK